jgi:diguanylate cyclase (GGDEF)-like protein
VKILIAEDDKISRRILQKVFAGLDYEVQCACDGDEAWKILEEPDHPHLLVLDWMMPGISGVELVTRLRTRPDGHTYYVLILTSLDTPKDTIFALEGGADDFISKPYHADTLRARVSVGRRIVSLHETLTEKIRALAEANETITRLAATDELTGLSNRRFFNGTFHKTLSAAQRHKVPLCFIMVDIDKFKLVNDNYGHDVGDKVLKVFAKTMIAQTRTEDIPARWGGEEFVILLPLTPIEGALLQANRLRNAFAADVERELSMTVTASFGVAQLQEGEDAEALIKRADKALYRAKEEGRNRVIEG